MDDQGTSRESGGMRSQGRRVLFLFIVIAAALVLAVAVGSIPAINRYRYERARAAYGGRRFTRSQAMEQMDNRTVYLLPDSEFLPEQPAKEN
jgi:hypothetical protein